MKIFILRYEPQMTKDQKMYFACFQKNHKFVSLLTSLTLKRYLLSMNSFMWLQMNSLFVHFLTCFIINHSSISPLSTLLWLFNWTNNLKAFTQLWHLKRYFSCRMALLNFQLNEQYYFSYRKINICLIYFSYRKINICLI